VKTLEGMIEKALERNGVSIDDCDHPEIKCMKCQRYLKGDPEPVRGQPEQTPSMGELLARLQEEEPNFEEPIADFGTVMVPKHHDHPAWEDIPLEAYEGELSC
jgi:hypothetical protein